MKINKLFVAILCVMSMVLGSCSEDKYTPAELLTSAQVYFPTSNPTSYEILKSDEAQTVNVTLQRIKTDDAITVKLVAEGADGDTISVPASVDFAAGSKTATIPVSCKSALMDYDVAKNISISIAEEAYQTPYGVSSADISIVVPAPWTPWINSYSDWTKAGYDADAWPLSKTVASCTGTYTYVNYWSGDDPGLPIEYRVSTIDPKQGQFRISNWGAGNPLVLDYNTETHEIRLASVYYLTENSSYGSVWVSDIIYYYGFVRALFGQSTANLEDDPDYRSTYDPETGLFKMFLAYYVTAGCFGYDAETFQCDGFYIPDYSVAMLYRGILTATDGTPYAQTIIQKGVDATNVIAAVVGKNDDTYAVADALASGELAGTEITEDGIWEFDLEGQTGELKVVVASIVDGAVASVAEAPFEYYGGGSTPWVSLGMGLYTDAFVSPLYTEEGTSSTYEVEVLESTDEPGRYRLVNAYGAGFPLSEEGTYDPSATTYLEINAQDPDGVYITTQDLGANLGDGPLAIVSLGGYYVENGYSVEELKGYGYLGTLKDGVITLPSFGIKNSEATYQGYTYIGDKGYYGAYNNEFKLVLPSARSAASKAKASKINSLKRLSKANGVQIPMRKLVDKNIHKSLKK